MKILLESGMSPFKADSRLSMEAWPSAKQEVSNEMTIYVQMNLTLTQMNMIFQNDKSTIRTNAAGVRYFQLNAMS